MMELGEDEKNFSSENSVFKFVSRSCSSDTTVLVDKFMLMSRIIRHELVV